jgi:predicted porin
MITLRHSIGITAAVLAALAAGPALADDPAAPSADGAPVLLIGDPAIETPAGDTSESSVWTDLRHFFSDTTFTFGAVPLDEDAAIDADIGYNAYARIDLDGFTIGSRFAQWAEPTFSGEENQSFGFGASYNLESWTVGIDWSRGNYDEAFLDVNSGETSDVIAFTSSYDLRPGVQINGLLEYSEEAPAPSGSDAGALTVGIGTLIKF